MRWSEVLRPDEVAALQKCEDRSWRQWLTVAIVVPLLAVLPILVYAVTGKGHWDHIVGRSEPVTAQIGSVWVDGRCRTGVDHYKAELSWTTDDGVSGHRIYQWCNDPELGDTVQVWVGPTGHGEIDSPTKFRLGLGLTGIGLSVIAGVAGAVVIIGPQRRRRRLLAVADSSLSPPVAVEVEKIKQRSRSVRMRMTESTPNSVTTSGVKIAAVLFNRDGDLTTASRTMAGSWWLHLGPRTDAKRRVALLTREHERCVIELPVSYGARGALITFGSPPGPRPATRSK